MQRIYSLNPKAFSGKQRPFYDFLLSPLEDPRAGMINEMAIDLVAFGHVRLPNHFHHFSTGDDFHEINFVDAGEGCILFNGKEIRMTPGNLYFFPAHGRSEARDNRSLKKIYLHFRAIYRHRDILDGMAPFSVAVSNSKKLFRRFSKTLRSPDVFSVKAVLNEILGLIHKPIDEHLRRIQATTAQFEPFFRFVESHASGEYPADAVAALFGKNKKRFSESFSRVYGYTPRQYFVRTVLVRIKEALFHTHQSIGGIGAAFGFSDPYYFSRYFKKSTGQSPSEFRESKTQKI